VEESRDPSYALRGRDVEKKVVEAVGVDLLMRIDNTQVIEFSERTKRRILPKAVSTHVIHTRDFAFTCACSLVAIHHARSHIFLSAPLQVQLPRNQIA